MVSSLEFKKSIDSVLEWNRLYKNKNAKQICEIQILEYLK